MDTQVAQGYLQERLFHFWNQADARIGFEIFQSIVERGLLLTCGDGPLVDRVAAAHGGREIVESANRVQPSRVCFTDIPEDRLESFTARYGKWGLGFSRRAILKWGGVPTWYLPNHASGEFGPELAARVLKGLADADAALRVLDGLFEAWKIHKLPAYDFFKKVSIGEKSLTAAQFSRLLQSAREGVERAWPFIHEMSSKGEDDHAYLSEREWRIVSAPEGPAAKLFRPLTGEEEAEVRRARPEWAPALRPGSAPSAPERPADTPLARLRYFNGLPGEMGIARAIEVVYVPDRRSGTSVSKYLEANPGRFRVVGPEVRVFGRNRPATRGWSPFGRRPRA